MINTYTIDRKDSEWIIGIGEVDFRTRPPITIRRRGEAKIERVGFFNSAEAAEAFVRALREITSSAGGEVDA